MGRRELRLFRPLGVTIGQPTRNQPSLRICSVRSIYAAKDQSDYLYGLNYMSQLP